MSVVRLQSQVFGKGNRMTKINQESQSHGFAIKRVSIKLAGRLA